MAREQFDLIVFDWDGTLMDSTAHITRSIQAACRDLGLPVPADEAASYVIGLGLRDALQIAAPDARPVGLSATRRALPLSLPGEGSDHRAVRRRARDAARIARSGLFAGGGDRQKPRRA